MKVEFLGRPPISGTIPERRYDAAGACTWGRFDPDDGGEWAGVFGAGEVAPRRPSRSPTGGTSR